MAKHVCPATHMLNLLSKRHMLVILYHVSQKPLGFNDIQELTDINTATLTARLRELVEEKLIERKTCETDARFQYYSLTKRGQKLHKHIAKFGDI